MSYNELRLIFEKLWDFNQKFVPMDAEKGSSKSKSLLEKRKKSNDKRKRKKSIPKKSTRKRLKMEKIREEELKRILDIRTREEVLSKGDGFSKNYKIFTEMLRDFDRHDVEELYRLVKERYRDSRPEGQEMISNMLKKRLEVDHESTHAIELLRFIRSQVQK
ncbi:hypothetical protein Tco_0799031 [Tanacetum coccineum]